MFDDFDTQIQAEEYYHDEYLHEQLRMIEEHGDYNYNDDDESYDDYRHEYDGYDDAPPFEVD